MRKPKDEMVAIPVADVVEREMASTDIYLKLSDSKYVLVSRAGTNVGDLSRYRLRAVEYFYVRISDYQNLVTHKLRIAGIMMGENLMPEKKIGFLSDAVKSILAEIDSFGMSKEAFSHAKIVSDAVGTLLRTQPSLLGLITDLKYLSDNLVNHSLAVSAVSVMIGSAQGWIKPATLERLALGGLLHDIGKIKMPRELLNKPVQKMMADEIILYEGHTVVGKQILSALQFVPEDLIAIAYEHHENSKGDGFPNKVRDVFINPLARVVGLADEFCKLTLREDGRILPMKPKEALHYIENMLQQPFNREAFGALKKLILNPGTAQPAA